MTRAVLAAACLALAACGTDFVVPQPLAFHFGPFSLGANEENADLCVAVTLHNDQPIYVNAAKIDGAPGIHHSNWVWVPDNNAFAFPEGAWKCSDGGGIGHGFDQAAAADFGGVLMAQSTQVLHEDQRFPAGAAIEIAPHARIVASIHLVNPSDAATQVPLTLTLTPIAATNVTKVLAGFAIEDESLALPPGRPSRFTVECDLSDAWHKLYASGLVDSPQIDFKIYHALSHYHGMGTGLELDAIRDSDGGVDPIWQTQTGIGDHLGGMLDPPFDMAGHSKLRLSCDYYNPSSATVGWGNADGEMCIAFAFTDSTRQWTAGQIAQNDPGPSTMDGSTVVFTAPTCSVATVDAEH